MPQSSQSNNNPISVQKAQRLILETIQTIPLSEQIILKNALDRITSDNIIAPINIPAFDNAAMDGYAFCAKDVTTNNTLHLVGSALAGHPYQRTMQAGQAIRITTGALMPPRCDTVLPYELANLITDNMLDMSNIVIKTGQHRRCCGEDLKIGDVAIKKGRRLGPAELGLLASLGLTKINVKRRLRIALFSTGDELRSDDQQLDTTSGSIYDSNRITLQAMLLRFGAEVIDLGVLNDDPIALEKALTKTASQADAIITSGGISTGTADYTRQVMKKIGGDIQFLSINMRPGRPFAFGAIYSDANSHHLAPHPTTTYLFGLPGNPVAMMVSFYFLVRPALQRLNDAHITTPLQITATAMNDTPKKIGRTEFQRGICDASDQGQLQVRITEKQGSAMLSSMSEANCIVILESGQADVKAGDDVKIILFDGLIQ